MKKRKVIIVGGGLAGLSAAYELAMTDNFDILMIEKDNRLGGRVCTATVKGSEVDMGGFLIYPWYKHYRQLIETLGLTKELIKVPNAEDYFVSEHNLQDEYHKDFKLSLRDLVNIFFEIFPKALIDTDPTDPSLDAYRHLTVSDYLLSLNFSPEKMDSYLKAFDTYLQGYCYGSIIQHKMAFMAATVFQNILHGDVHASSYMRNGSKVFVDAMHKELERIGVHFQFNCSLESIKNKQLDTNLGTLTADDFIFCHHPPEVLYSKFITVTISYTGTAQVNGDSNWGSCFYRENPKELYSILSIVNIEKLYGKKVSDCLNLNIKVNQTKYSILNDEDLLVIIRNQMQRHFKDITVLAILKNIPWEKAMPIAIEGYVEERKKDQGRNNFYYAGDFIGCPSMETALMSGKRAADLLISNVVKTDL